MALKGAVEFIVVYVRVLAAVGLIITLAIAAYLSGLAGSVTGTAIINIPGVVIDAGHGGYDGGAEWGGVQEKDVNLALTLQLREIMLAAGFRVALTRYGDYSLVEGEEVSGPKKREDMARRLAVIDKHQPDVVILMHCNAIRSSLWSGAQAFYQQEFDQGKLLAEDIQYYLGKFTESHREAKPSDLYLLRESETIGALVEAGFLSNPAERELLLQVSYQRTIGVAVWLGVVRYTHHPLGHQIE
jgi:N-acetylmuramoyl-L-alanine amidase